MKLLIWLSLWVKKAMLMTKNLFQEIQLGRVQFLLYQTFLHLWLRGKLSLLPLSHSSECIFRFQHYVGGSHTLAVDQILSLVPHPWDCGTSWVRRLILFWLPVIFLYIRFATDKGEIYIFDIRETKSLYLWNNHR